MPRILRQSTPWVIGLALLAGGFVVSPFVAHAAPTEEQIAKTLTEYSVQPTAASAVNYIAKLDPELSQTVLNRIFEARETYDGILSPAAKDSYLRDLMASPNEGYRALSSIVSNSALSGAGTFQMFQSALGANAAARLASTQQGSQVLATAQNSIGGNTAAQQQAIAEATANNEFGCVGSLSINLSLCISNVVYVFTVGLGSALAYVGAYFFDITVSLGLNSAAYALDFISKGWTTARDLANMGFILALVYIAYTIILKAEGVGTIKWLAWVIIMALIINFSFFFTRLVIDAGNILAVQFYNAIDVRGPDGQPQTIGRSLQQSSLANVPVTGAETFWASKDLTYPIMQGLSLQNLFNDRSWGQWFAGQKGLAGGITVAITLSFLYICVGIMYFILAIMFLTAGIKFMFRIVVLWFLIIVSPLAFLSKTTTITEKYYDLWQSKLIMHVFYPVVFLFIFLFVALFMSTLNTQGGIIGGLFGQLNNVNNQVNGISYLGAMIANVAIRLGFVVAMLYIAMKAADSMGVVGAKAAHTFTNSVFGGAFGSLGLAGRYTAGFAGTRLAASALGTRMSNGGALSRSLYQSANRVGSANYDLRNISSVRKGLGLVNVDPGRGAEGGGYKATFDARMKRHDAEGARIKDINDRAIKQAIKEQNLRSPDYEKNLRSAAASFEAAQEELAAAASHGSGSPEHKAAIAKHEAARKNFETIAQEAVPSARKFGGSGAGAGMMDPAKIRQLASTSSKKETGSAVSAAPTVQATPAAHPSPAAGTAHGMTRQSAEAAAQKAGGLDAANEALKSALTKQADSLRYIVRKEVRRGLEEHRDITQMEADSMPKSTESMNLPKRATPLRSDITTKTAPDTLPTQHDTIPKEGGNITGEGPRV